MNPRIKPLAAAMLVLGSPAAFAQEQSALAPITVTATRYPTLLENSAGQVEVLTAEELQTRNSPRLSDAINILPGVFVQTGRGILQPSQTMSIRGVPGDNRALVLLDGVPLNDGYSGSINFGGLPIDNIERVEVLYGPTSSLYGGNAMGGVVSYTTRMPQKTEFSFGAGFGKPFEAGLAPENVRRVSLSAGTKFNNDLSVLAGAHWLASDGYRTELVTTGAAPAASVRGWSSMPQRNNTRGYLVGNRGRTEWDEDGEYLKLEQRLADGSRWRFGWQRQAYVYTSIDPQTYLRDASGNPLWQCCLAGSPARNSITEGSFLIGEGAYDRNLYQLGYDTEWLDGFLKVSAGHSDVTTNSSISADSTATRTGGAGTINDSPAHSDFFDAYWNRDIGAHGLTFGLAYRADKADSQTYNLRDWRESNSKTSLSSKASGQTSLKSAYVQDTWRLAAPLTLTGALRYDYWETVNGQSLATVSNVPIRQSYADRSASALSPKLGLAFQPIDTVVLRVSAGSAFRAPSVFDLYKTTITSGTRTEADPSLKPETVKTWEFGGEWKPWRGGQVGLTFFNNDLYDLIYRKSLGIGSDNRSLFRRVNAGHAESRGYTLSLSHRFDAENRLFANFTRASSEIKENDAAPASVGKRLAFMPDRQANAGFETRRGDWTLAAAARYGSKQFSLDDNSDVASGVYQAYDAYVVADAKVSYRIDRNLTAALSIDNLFDREYFSFYPAPRRSWFAEVNYRY